MGIGNVLAHILKFTLSGIDLTKAIITVNIGDIKKKVPKCKFPENFVSRFQKCLRAHSFFVQYSAIARYQNMPRTHEFFILS